MLSNLRVALVVLALSTSQSTIAASEDEAWIENFMSRSGQSAAPSKIQRGYLVNWKDLSNFIGVPVKVITDTGSIHYGRVEQINADGVLLRSRMHGGYADLRLRRDQVRSTEVQ